MLRSTEELREALELLPLWVAALLAELPERTALELEDPLRVVVPLLRVELELLRVELELLELPLRVLEPLLLVLPLWLLRVELLLPL